MENGDKRSPAARAVEKFVERASELGWDQQQIDEAFAEVADKGAESVAAELRRTAAEMLAEHGAWRSGFEERIGERWGDALDRFYQVAVCAEEMGSTFHEKHRGAAAEEQDFVFEAVTRIHARACLTSFEIHSALRTGFPTSAQRSARTLHELAVVATVLVRHGRQDDVAERYLLSEHVERYRDGKEHQLRCDDLGYEPIPDDDLAEMRRRRDAVIGRFGNEMKEQYGWAKPVLAGPNLRTLEEHVGLGYLRPFYQWESHGTHATAKGAALNIRERGPHRIKLAGPTNAGFSEIGHRALISLLQETTSVILQGRGDVQDPMDLVGIGALARLVDEAGEEFFEAERRLAEEEAQLWATDESPSTP